MADVTPDPIAPSRPNAFRGSLYPFGCVLLAAAATALCRDAAGVSLGLFFGGFAAATLLVPSLTAGEDAPRRRVLIPCGVTLGVAAVWLTVTGERLTFSQWLACSVALLAYASALCGITFTLLSARFNPAAAAALVTFPSLLWLTWPVWLSHALLRPGGDAAVAWLVPAHPLFAVNGVLIHFDTWDRHPLAYARLTVLNQDVFYALPRGVLWATLAHAAIALLTFGAAHVLRGQVGSPVPRAAGSPINVPPARTD